MDRINSIAQNVLTLEESIRSLEDSNGRELSYRAAEKICLATRDGYDATSLTWNASHGSLSPADAATVSRALNVFHESRKRIFTILHHARADAKHRKIVDEKLNESGKWQSYEDLARVEMDVSSPEGGKFEFTDCDVRRLPFFFTNIDDRIIKIGILNRDSGFKDRLTDLSSLLDQQRHRNTDVVFVDHTSRICDTLNVFSIQLRSFHADLQTDQGPPRPCAEQLSIQATRMYLWLHERCNTLKSSGQADDRQFGHISRWLHVLRDDVILELDGCSPSEHLSENVSLNRDQGSNLSVRDLCPDAVRTTDFLIREVDKFLLGANERNYQFFFMHANDAVGEPLKILRHPPSEKLPSPDDDMRWRLVAFPKTSRHDRALFAVDSWLGPSRVRRFQFFWNYDQSIQITRILKGIRSAVISINEHDVGVECQLHGKRNKYRDDGQETSETLVSSIPDVIRRDSSIDYVEIKTREFVVGVDTRSHRRSWKELTLLLSEQSTQSMRILPILRKIIAGSGIHGLVQEENLLLSSLVVILRSLGFPIDGRLQE